MNKQKDLSINQQFERLTVISLPFKYISKNECRYYISYLCRCECGNVLIISKSNLIHGKTKSCGCLHQDTVTTHGNHRTKLYGVWGSMLQRCNNPKNVHYHFYGGRGISVCDSWAKFDSFLTWAKKTHYKPGLQIDRIDNNKGYSEDNCRWITSGVNNSNKRNNLNYEAFGEEKCLSHWAKDSRCVVPFGTLYFRVVVKGWDIVKALSVKSGTEKPRVYQQSRHRMFSAFGEAKSIRDWSKDNRCKISESTLYSRLAVLKWNDVEEAITKQTNVKKI